MLKEAIEKIAALAAPTIVRLESDPELNFADKPVNLIVPPALDTVRIVTLTGLVDLIRSNVDAFMPDSWMLHVLNYQQVQLKRRITDRYGRRLVLANVVFDEVRAFPFGRFVDREEFVIGLQSQFMDGGDRDEVLRLASTLEASLISQSEDDGISQRATVKQGVALKQTTIVKGRVALRPYRTFSEIEQPLSEFVFRLRSEAPGDVPTCALIEADGGAWKHKAVQTIKAWLEAKNTGMPVVA